MTEHIDFFAQQQSALSRRKFLGYTAVGASAIIMPTLAQAKGSELQNQLNQLVQQQRKSGMLSRNERTAWSVYDFQTRQKLVSINENRSMQAASMIKVFVALAYFYLNKQAPHKYPYNANRRYLMQMMLVKSDNKATNTMMKLCGGPRNVQVLCQRATHNRFKQLRIVEYIPAGGRTYRNKASARDYSRFLYDLWAGKLPHSNELKRIMSIVNNDRIKTQSMAANVKVFDKTGSTGMLCGDMGIVQLDHKRAYTFIGVIERSNKTKSYGPWITKRSKAMRQASDLVYDFMSKRYKILSSL
ncbi:MAG: serine hydrolase [Gammaproteobacteria bacterium]|nr:serine hydrolase [Gammaproteobacteria bacterium]